MSSLMSWGKIAVWAGRRRRWLIALGLVIGVLAGLRAILPTVAERAVAWSSQYYLGLPARVENVDLSLLAGGVVLENVRVGAVAEEGTPWQAALHPRVIDPKASLLHIERLAFRWSWWGLLRGRLQIKEFTLHSPTVRLLREADGQIDPLRQAKPLAPPMAAKPEPPAKGGSRSWPIEVRRFALKDPNVKILDVPTGQDLLVFSLESFELDEASWRESELGFGSMAVRGPVLKVKRELVLAEPERTGEKTAAQREAGAGTAGRPGFRIRKVDVERAEFTWLSARGPLDVMMKLKASGITAEQGKRFPLELALQIGTGRADLSGEVGMLPPYYKGRLKWDGISFAPLLMAAVPDLAAWLKSTDGSGDLRITADLAGVAGSPGIHLAGRTTVENFSAADPAGGGFALGWKRLDVVMKEAVIPLAAGGGAAPLPSLELERVTLQDPRILYTHPWPLLETFLGWDPAQKATMVAFVLGILQRESEDEQAVGRAALDLLEIKGGEIEMRDTTAAAQATVRGMDVTLRNMNFPEMTFEALSMQATLPTDSRFSLEGSLKAGQTGDFVISLQGLDLPTFSPYAKDAGVTLDAGRFSLQTRLKMEGGVMTMDNDVTLNKLGVSLSHADWFGREFGVPINLALALLRDAGGDIRLQVPMRRDEKGTTISMGAVVASALRASILGAISSPLKLAGIGMGGNGSSGQLSGAAIKNVAGAADPAQGAAARLDGLARLLAERPELQLALRGRIGPEDLPILADRQLVENARAKVKLPELPQVGFLARRRIGIYLAKRAKGEDATLGAEDQALYARYVAAVQVPDDQLQLLARQRAEKVRDLLVARKVDSKRLAVGEREADGQPGVVISFQPPPSDGGKPVKAPATKKPS
ncbi:hypothetical protein DB345_03710 [Spartobacteria bacterium LR76]|nr:hypothetical protein DB345_03710 [Spartobacteria bacterium LR76]